MTEWTGSFYYIKIKEIKLNTNIENKCYENHIINLDKLEIKVLQDFKSPFYLFDIIPINNNKDLIETGNNLIKLIRIVDKNYSYSQVFNLYIKERFFGVLKLYPYFKKSFDLISIGVDKECLYKGFNDDLIFLFNELSLTINNISYLDICIDSNTDYGSQINNYWNDKDYKFINQKYIEDYNRTDRELTKSTSFYIGSGYFGLTMPAISVSWVPLKKTK